jgi:hypothetical protein
MGTFYACPLLIQRDEPLGLLSAFERLRVLHRLRAVEQSGFVVLTVYTETAVDRVHT